MKTTIALALALLTSSALAEPITKIEWSDGDSGRYWTQHREKVPFRLNGWDAAETTWRAQCKLELERGFIASGWMRGFTTIGVELELLETGRSYRKDQYGREVMDLLFNGRDLASIAAQDGYLKPWPHRGSRALTVKPDWCVKGRK